MQRALAAVFLIASLAAAQQQPPAPEKNDAAKTRIEGRVLTVGGDPVPRATLRMRGGPITADRAAQLVGYTATSDADGNFVIEDVPPGDYTFLAEKTGFVNQGYQAQTPGTNGAPFRIAAGQTIENVVFRLSANAVVGGIVTTPEGDPVVGKQVSLFYRNWVRGDREWFTRNTARTDDRGQFRIAGVAPGRYLLRIGEPDVAAPAPPQDQPANLEQTFVNTYYPGTNDIDAATYLTLGPGTEITGLKIEIRPARVFTLRVAALDEAGNLVPGAALAIRTRSMTSTALVNSATRPMRSADGYFLFRNLVAGTYILQARPRPQALDPVGASASIAQLYGRLEVTITDHDVDEAVIRLTPNVPAIDVNVTVEDGDEAALRASQPILRLTEPEIPGLNNRVFRMLPNGWYRAESVARSVYGVDLSPLPAGMYVKSVRFGGQDVTRSPLDLTSVASGSIDIVVSGKAADVSGVARDERGGPMAAAAVALWPKTPDRSNLQGGSVVAVTGADGVFRLTNLAPGDYYLAGWEEIRTGQAESVAFRALFTGEAEEIDLDEGAHVTRDLKPISAAEAERRTATLP